MRALVVVGFALVALGCKTLPKTPQGALDALAAMPGRFLTGAPAALGPGAVLNSEDFVYDARLSYDARSAAVSRLGMKSFYLSLFTMTPAPPLRRADVAVNALEFDVEALDWAPDGKAVVAVSKDRAVRVFSAEDASLLATWLTEEPLVSVAVSPSGEHLAVGSTRGLVTLLSFPKLSHLAEVRAHADEVRALVFAKDGTLFSGGWDKKLVAWAIADSNDPPRSARVAFEKKAGLLLVRAVLDNAAVAGFSIDARVPMVVVRGALAQAAGIDPTALTETITVQTAFGNQVAKVVHARKLTFKSLVFEDLDVAVCDACVPPDAQGVLGQALLERLDYASDETTGELQLTAKEGAQVSSTSKKNITAARRFTFDAFVNDVSVDAAGAVLGVAFSEAKGQRTREVYEREKRKEVEPEREWDCGARVDAKTGKVLERKHGHNGVVATAGISPDGKTLATGGWDRRVLLHGEGPPVVEKFGWAVRRARFSRDGRWLVVAAWTPQNPLNDHQSDPSAVVYEVLYREASASP